MRNISQITTGQSLLKLMIISSLGMLWIGLGCATHSRVRLQDEKDLVKNSTAAGKTLSQWIDRTPAANRLSSPPHPAEDCAMIYDPRAHRIILFGGKNDEDQNMNETWAYNLATNQWQKIVIEGKSPPPTEDHTAIYDPIGYRMILYGGENGPTWNNTWSFDLATHHWHDITDPDAPATEDHTAIYDSRGKRMVVFGGKDHDYSNLWEIWALDLNPQSNTFEKWINLTVKKKHPNGRADHVAVYDSLKNRMVIFGGWNHDHKKYLDDTWAFYFDKKQWKHLKTKKSHPPKRRHAVGVYDSQRNWFIVFGGLGERGYLNDAWALDLTYDVWLNITPGPQPRIDLQAIYDPGTKSLILYGGDAKLSKKFHDLWQLSIRPDIPVMELMKAAGLKNPGKAQK